MGRNFPGPRYGQGEARGVGTDYTGRLQHFRSIDWETALLSGRFLNPNSNMRREFWSRPWLFSQSLELHPLDRPRNIIVNHFDFDRQLRIRRAFQILGKQHVSFGF